MSVKKFMSNFSVRCFPQEVLMELIELIVWLGMAVVCLWVPPEYVLTGKW